MTDNNIDTAQDPAAIEQDIRRTQEDMSRTVDKIGDQLTARNIFNALLDKADENNVDARMILDGARRNPVALGLIAAGAIWLISDKDSKIPSVGAGKLKEKWGGGSDDVHHRDYVSHMSSIEMRDGEDPIQYQHRRDIARANFLMVERGHDEDDHGFRQRLDSMTDSFREKRRAWSESSGQAGSAAKEKGRMAVDKAQQFYSSNPLVGGVLAAAAGAAFGSSLPISRQEQEKLGAAGEKVREMASDQKDHITSKLQDAKDQLVDQADERIQEHSPQEESGQQTNAGQEFQRT